MQSSRIKKSSKSSHQRGQATLEYVLLLSVLALMSFGFVKTINAGLQTGITYFTAVLEQDLSPGSYREKREGRAGWRMEP